MTNCALITGASSGIGAALARLHASEGGDVILVARRADKLDALKAELEAAHGITATIFTSDLAAPGAAEKLYTDIKSAGVSVDILINNAGRGGHGQFVERDLADDLSMIDLNVMALVALTHLIAKDMVAQGSGKILHVGSTAGFIPGPGQAIYFATKAFVNSFSQALDQELKGTGVTSTVLAPGYVETEFADAANLRGTNMVKGGGATAESAAKCGYDAMMKGSLVAINDRKLGFMLKWIIPFMPRRMVLKQIEASQAKA